MKKIVKNLNNSIKKIIFKVLNKTNNFVKNLHNLIKKIIFKVQNKIDNSIKNLHNLIKKTIFKVQNKSNNKYQISNFNKFITIFIALLFLFLIIAGTAQQKLNSFPVFFISISIILFLDIFFLSKLRSKY